MPVRDADALPFAAPTVPLTRQALRQARLRCDDTASFVPPTASFVPPTTSAGRAGACLPPPQLPRLTSRDSAGGVKLAAWLSTSPSPPTSPALPRPHRPNPPVVQRQIQPVPPPPASGVLTRAMLRQARGGPIAVDDAKLASVARPPGRHTAALPVVTPAAPTPVNASSDMAEPTAATTGALPVIAPTADDSFTEYIAARCINFQPLTLPTVEPQTSRSIAQALAQRGVAAGNQLAKAARQLPNWSHHLAQRLRQATDQEICDSTTWFARRTLRPLTAVAAAALGSTMIYSQAPHNPGQTAALEDVSVNALTPLRQAVELVSRRGVESQVSRSGTRNRAVKDAAAVAKRSDATITIRWENPELGPNDQVVVRRAQGAKPPQTVKDGEPVSLPQTQADVAVDSGLAPDTAYSYAVFVVTEDAKPRIAAEISAKTRRHPVELKAGDSLVAGERLVSANGEYYLTVTDDGRLELYNPSGTRIWTPSIVSPRQQATLVMTTDGQLELNGEADEPLWATATGGNPGASLRLTNDGDIQIRLGDQVIWHRGKVGNIALGDDYPFGWGSPLGYAPRNCTDFVAWRLNRYAGITKGPWRYRHATMTPGGGNAVQWINYFPKQTDNNPALGAVAWWGSSSGGGRGHVAIVTAIHSDGSITIEEYNFYNRHAYGQRHLYPGQSDWPAKFIHIHDIK